MSTFLSVTGTIYSGIYAVAEITGWDHANSRKLVDDTNMNSTEESFKVSLKAGAGRIKCHFDPEDTNGQNTLRDGETVTLHIYPRGKIQDKDDYNGSVKIEEFKITGEKEGLVEAEFSYRGYLTEGVVP